MTQREGSADLTAFLNKVEAVEAVIGVVGLGYVGLPVALSFAEAGFRVHGVDLDDSRIRSIEAGESYLGDVSASHINKLSKPGRFSVGSSYESLVEADAILIAVPTPLIDGAPDLSKVVAAGTSLTRVLQPNSLVVLESTTYPGTTQELLAPLLEESGMIAGRDFYLAFSPERIDPANPIYDFRDIPKVIGGVNEDSTRAASSLYESVLPRVFLVSSPKEAELSKLIENTFRHVNIALVNELAVYAHEMDVDIWESIEAAGTKPFGFMPFWPGPGWGGHCIPLDPTYLSWRVRKDRSHEVRFVELAHTVNAEMPRYVVERAALMLNAEGKAVRNSRILGIGVAYKSGTEDIRESAGVKVLDLLASRGADVSYLDPLVPETEINGTAHRSLSSDSDYSEFDLVIVLVAQAGIDWERVSEGSPAALDCCNVLNRASDRVQRL